MGDHDDVRHQVASVPFLVGCKPAETGPIGVHSVIGPLPRDEDSPIRLADGIEVAASHLCCGVHRVGSSGAEEHLRPLVGGNGRDLSGELNGGPSRVVDESMKGGQLPHLLAHRIDDLVSAVPDIHVPKRCCCVEIAVAAFVEDVDSLSSIDDERVVLDIAHVSKRMPEGSHVAERSAGLDLHWA